MIFERAEYTIPIQIAIEITSRKTFHIHFFNIWTFFQTLNREKYSVLVSVYMVIYTTRNDAIRLISARKATERAKEILMKGSKKQRLEEIEKIQDNEIDYSDIPELDDTFWDNANILYPENKKPITLRLDSEVLDWFRSTDKGYQTRINAILKSYLKAHKKG